MSKLLAAALVAVVSTAHAQTLVATDRAEPRAPREVDARLGLLLGGSDVGDADGFSTGVSAAMGYSIGDLAVRGVFDYFKIGDGSGEALARKGRASRIGGALRYSFANTGRDTRVLVDFWGELGAGYEHAAWRRGGVLDRPSLELAVGLDVGRRGVRDHERGRRAKIGYFMAFRSMIAQGPEMAGAMSVCSGPCSRATRPPRTDVNMFFSLGVHWGR